MQHVECDKELADMLQYIATNATGISMTTWGKFMEIMNNRTKLIIDLGDMVEHFEKSIEQKISIAQGSMCHRDIKNLLPYYKSIIKL